jgi:hypothetical protein
LTPDKVAKFENIISLDPKNNSKEYCVKVWFSNDKNENFLYNYTLSEGLEKGSFNIERI